MYMHWYVDDYSKTIICHNQLNFSLIALFFPNKVIWLAITNIFISVAASVFALWKCTFFIVKLHLLHYLVLTLIRWFPAGSLMTRSLSPARRSSWRSPRTELQLSPSRLLYTNNVKCYIWPHFYAPTKFAGRHVDITGWIQTSKWNTKPMIINTKNIF